MAPRILFIDDLAADHWIVSTFLSGASFEIVSSGDPDFALATARLIQPATIVIDPAMANHQGWELLAELQSDPALGRIPTVVYTALPEWVIADHAARCLYDDLRYVDKQEDLDRLLDRLAEATGTPSLVESWSA